MYLQITTRCNMTCDHCAFACDSKGEDMSIGVVEAALEVFGGEIVAIGGGEPTVHPRFWQILGILLSESDDLWMATNGKRTKDALRLAKLARKGVLGVALSLDEWHDEIDFEVEDAFHEGRRPFGAYGREDKDLREVRGVKKIMRRGRAADWREDERAVELADECACPDIFVDPRGDVWACGCKEEKFGNVLKGVEIPEDYYERDEQCSRYAAVEA